MNLNSLIEENFRLVDVQKRALKKLGLKTFRDLLFYFPSRYESFSERKNIIDLAEGDKTTVYGEILNIKKEKTWRKKLNITEAEIMDQTGSIKATWFHQPYIANILKTKDKVALTGKISTGKSGLYLSNPSYEKITSYEALGEGGTLLAIYPETRGLTSRWVRFAIQRIFNSIIEFPKDPIPENILADYHLPSLKSSLVFIHAPQKLSDAEASRKRFSFEEIFFIQLARLRQRRELDQKHSFVLKISNEEIKKFLSVFPFELTQAQKKAIWHIIKDFETNKPMSRLLEGDVGSGKTAVAVVASYIAVKNGLQVAYMAPTEILSQQHFQSFINYFSQLRLTTKIGLITSSGCKKFPSKVSPSKPTEISRSQLLKWVANREIPILIGTHSLIQDKVKFKNLALVIIDEQHRFGVNQRKALASGKTQTNTQTDAEIEKEKLIYKNLSYIIRGAVFEVKKRIGLGHKEIIYQKALEEEFIAKKIIHNREKQIPIFYRNKKIGTYQPDFIVDDKIIVELKALPFLGNTEKKQIWTYLKGSEYKLALLINFGTTELQIERIIYDSARTSASGSRESASVPHLLSMTATPIPRTLALTIYGDLDLTLLDEMPIGRQPIITEIIEPEERNSAYEKIKKEIKNGRQAYIICPLIETGKLEAKNVKQEADRLKKEVFPEFEIGILHGKILPKEKEKILKDFRENKIQILVSTSVIEVGIDVPNATIIVIEGAERFGLAQLHQLRGRVMRSTFQSYCFVFTDSHSQKTHERLNALVKAKNGFELAEYDLQFRGPGELGGLKQWGVSDIGMEALKNIKMVEAARLESQKILETDPELKKYPLISERLKNQDHLHFE